MDSHYWESQREGQKSSPVFPKEQGITVSPLAQGSCPNGVETPMEGVEQIPTYLYIRRNP